LKFYLWMEDGEEEEEKEEEEEEECVRVVMVYIIK
jgi:hypothetical protein